jgi:hypothetical protein
MTPFLTNPKSSDTGQAAAWCLSWIGAAARPLLPTLRTGLTDADPKVRAAFQTAIDRIEKARPESRSEAEIERKRSISKDLDELKTVRKK